jgi:septal ring factor EnvC (AmiA/AmiB activator)
MWPKALAQLIELAPHLARLLPMADRFFQSKTADAEASATAMQQMAEGLRGDLGQVTASHAGLYRQLNDQSEKLSTLTADLAATRTTVETFDHRLLTLEQKAATIVLLLSGLAVSSLVILVLLVILLLRH